MSSFFGTIDYLNRNIDYKSYRADKAVRKIAGSGDPVRSVAESEGSGGVHFTANLQNLNKYKRGSINAFQNALSMMQMQSEGLRQAEKIYNRMLSVAQMASDPSADSETRNLLSKEFADLREQSIAINAMTINGKDLFDARAASTQYSVDFSQGAQASDPASGGFLADGTIVYGGTNSDTVQPFWDVQKDVIYNSGELTLDFRPLSLWDRLIVFQEDSSKPIFDTGEWQGGSWDRFVIEYGSDQETTFRFTNSPENGTGNHFSNKLSPSGAGLGPGYLGKFGLTDDGSASGMQDFYNKDITTLGQVTTSDSDQTTSKLTLRVIGRNWGTGYDLQASWSPLEMDDSVVGRSEDMQVNLNQMGLGYLRENESDFPTISVGTTADALSAIDVLRAEIDNLGEQNGRIASNFTLVEIAMDAAQKQIMTQEKVLEQSGAGDVTADLLELSKTRIERQQNAALMTQAMSIHQDLVNLLI
jgi:flagellin-like hook-associated protein FlgL